MNATIWFAGALYAFLWIWAATGHGITAIAGSVIFHMPAYGMLRVAERKESKG